MKPVMTATALALTLTTLAGCSMPKSGNESAADTRAKVKRITVNNHTVPIPAGYTYGDQQTNQEAENIVLLDKSGLPLNITVASKVQKFDVKKWCNDMSAVFSKNYQPGAKITTTLEPASSKTPTGCQVLGHGKTKGASSDPSASAAPRPSGMSAQSIAPGTPYSILVQLKKSKSGKYVAMLSRHLEANSTFATEKSFFNTIAS